MIVVSRSFFLTVVVLIFCIPGLLLAATNTFPIKAFVGNDTLPPTVPALLTVVPVSPLQINLTWSVSTDNVFLSGYRLFRDGVQIATTSQTLFVDTGLTPETLYTYTVDAFDSYGNFSSSSAPVATTTLALPVIPPVATTTPTSTRSTSGTAAGVARLESFEVRPTQRSAFFIWETNTNVRYTLQWGRTSSYELGTVSTNIYNVSHQTTIENLEPGTQYWYVITSTNARGVSQVTKQGSFETLPTVQTTLPRNVSNLNATVRDATVSLRWQNPPLVPGAKIRVLRSHLFYPLSLNDGGLVYEGVGTGVTDTAALSARSPQYYTVFVIDENGLVSSGAVVMAALLPEMGAVGTSSGVGPTLPPTTEIGPDTVLKAAGVFVRQGTITQTLAGPLELDFSQPFVLFIPVDAVTTHLKTIMATVQDPTDQRLSASYLLRLNQAGDAYEVSIEPPYVRGASRVILEIIDFNQATVRRVIVPILFIEPSVVPVAYPDPLLQYYYLAAPVVVVGGVLLISFWWLIFFIRRLREDKQ